MKTHQQSLYDEQKQMEKLSRIVSPLKRFNLLRIDWQYASGGVKAPCPYNRIRFYIDYERNINEAYFDGLALFRETFYTKA